MARDYGMDVAVVGGGPAGLMAAQTARAAGRSVHVFERMRSTGRKFLVAGKGGLNLTHSEPLDVFLSRYRESAERLRPFLEEFPPARLRQLADSLGQPTYAGSSGRVFPREGRAAPMLRAWLARLRAAGVVFHTRQRWLGFEPGSHILRFQPVSGAEGEPVSRVDASAVVLALGGASWPETGSDGSWVPMVRDAGIAVRDLTASNAGFEVPWPERFVDLAQGGPLKNVAVTFSGETVRGDLTVSAYGLEGTPVYRLTPSMREALARARPVRIEIDLKPDLGEAAVLERLARVPDSKSLSNRLRSALKLDPAARALIGRMPAGMNLDAIARRIKGVPLEVTGIRPVNEAISSAGGVAWSGLTNDLMLRDLPGVFVAGEMIDWEAPTGGYLLQACFSTGYAAGAASSAWVVSPRDKEVR